MSLGFCLISVAVVVLALGFVPHAGRTGASISETVRQSATDRKTWQAEFATSSIDRDSALEPLEADSASASFDELFTGAVDSRGDSQNTTPRRPDGGARVGAQRPVGWLGRGSAPFVTLPPAATRKPLRVADASTQEDSSLLSDAAARIAIYDIAAHSVYLPNGQRLEAHSGLGKYRDDPRHVSEKDRGPTPPNVYDLSLREHLFHGVRAIRLIPAGIGNMFGRNGMLAHTYMRGRSGQSNGCVSFSDYNAFLNVVRSGEINRLVVVEHLATMPDSRSTSEWPPETIKALVGAIQSAPSGGAIVVNSGIEVTEDPAPVGATPLEPDASVDARIEF